MEPVIWPADPHTIAKHAIVGGYLRAWFGILPAGSSKVVYFDGFAGPGRYAGGEPGSPLVAIDAAIAHAANKPATTFIFTLVERDESRAARLRDEISAKASPSNIRVQVHTGECAAELQRNLDALDKAGLRNAPIFAFIDPFGIDGFPFDLIRRLLARPRTEVLITFMASYVKRFADQWTEKLADVFGSAVAAEGISSTTAPHERLERARSEYEASLRRVARFVRYFTMLDRGGRTIYDLFFASNHPLGHLKMKEAMRSVGHGGEFAFRDGVGAGQAALFDEQIPRDLAARLVARFAGRVTDAAEVRAFVLDDTAYVGKDFTAAMRLLEGGLPQLGRLAVAALKRDGTPRKAGTFPDGTVVTFPSPES